MSMDFPRSGRHPAASRCGALEGLGNYAAEVAMPPDSIIERLDVKEDVTEAALLYSTIRLEQDA